MWRAVRGLTRAPLRGPRRPSAGTLRPTPRSAVRRPAARYPPASAREHLLHRLLRIAIVHGPEPDRACRLDVRLEVVDEEALPGRQAEPGAREAVDRGVGLAQTDEGRVDDELEELVDGEDRAPARLPLAHVVRQQRGAVARGARAGGEVEHGLVRAQRGPVALGELVHGDGPAHLGRQRAADPVQEVGLGHPPELELVDGVGAVGLCHRRDRAAEGLEGNARVVLEGGEAGQQRRRQNAADVADQRPEAPGRRDRRRRRHVRRRTS